MKTSQVAFALGAVAVLIGGAAAYYAYTASAKRESEVTRLVKQADALLAKSEPDRSELSKLVRILRAALEAGDDVRLVRTLARAQFAMGRYRQAWETISTNTYRENAAAEDQLLGARIGLRWAGAKMDPDVIARAMLLAEQHHDATGDMLSLFMAWQAAARGQLRDDVVRLSERFGDSDAPVARVVRLMDRLDPEKLDPAVAAGLRRVESDFGDDAPAELEVALAIVALHERAKRGKTDDDPLARLLRVYERLPSHVEAHHWLAVAYHYDQKFDERNLHARWLLENAAVDDPRRDVWSRMAGG